MQNRYVIIKGELFDRELLVEATTKDGILVPRGGVIIGKNSLAGFIYSDKCQKIKWKIIGKINDSLVNYIPKYKMIQNKNYIDNIDQSPTSISKDKVKNIIQIFRNYYRNIFN